MADSVETTSRLWLGYLKTVPGILRISHIVLGLIIVICVESVGSSESCRIFYPGQLDYAVFVGASSIILAGLLICAFVTKLHLMLENFLYAPWILLVVDVTWAVFHLISAVLLFVAACYGQSGVEAAAVFCVFGFVAFVAAGVMSLRSWFVNSSSTS